MTLRASHLIAAALALGSPMASGMPPLDSGATRDPVREMLPPGGFLDFPDAPTGPRRRRAGGGVPLDMLRPNPFAPAERIVTASDRERAEAERVARAEAKRARKAARR
jgi:hypothetical protein